LSDVQNKSGPKGKLALVIWGVALIGVAAFIYVIASSTFKPKEGGSLTSYRKGSIAMLQVPGEVNAKDPRLPDLEPLTAPPAAPPPDMPITGPDGKPVKIADFKGKVAVVNIWATWCAPCKIEMPTLARLQAAYATQPLEVVAISTDVADPSKYPGETQADAVLRAKAELAKSPPLKFYYSPGTDIIYAFMPPTPGLPTTIIYDKKGVERARLAKEADWNSKEARALIERLLEE
jgi:thiol-disulfide isomerase/thioredoxin